jgi:hypothetical protein
MPTVNLFRVNDTLDGTVTDVADSNSRVEPVVSNSEQLPKERRPTAINADNLLDLMQQTRAARRSWIESNAPTISDILVRYPRFIDLQDSVC